MVFIAVSYELAAIRFQMEIRHGNYFRKKSVAQVENSSAISVAEKGKESSFSCASSKALAAIKTWGINLKGSLDSESILHAFLDVVQQLLPGLHGTTLTHVKGGVHDPIDLVAKVY